jgi:CBS domain-containing protein
MRVRDVMTSPAVTVRPEATLRDVAAVLGEHRISGAPVVSDDGRVLGVVSEEDFLHKEREATDARRRRVEEKKARARTAGEAMSAPPITTGPNHELSEVASVMLDKHVRRLPVVDADGRLLGIVTRSDLVRAFVRPDEEIAREIEDDVIARRLEIPSGRVRAVVESGEVTLTGEVGSRAESEELLEFVRRVPGVVSVVPQITTHGAAPAWGPPGRYFD